MEPRWLILDRWGAALEESSAGWGLKGSREDPEWTSNGGCLSDGWLVGSVSVYLALDGNRNQYFLNKSEVVAAGAPLSRNLFFHIHNSQLEQSPSRVQCACSQFIFRLFVRQILQNWEYPSAGWKAARQQTSWTRRRRRHPLLFRSLVCLWVR